MCAIMPNSAMAFCIAPSMYEIPPTTPGSFSKPSAPDCLSGCSYTRTHTCESYEIDSYIDEINTCVGQLNSYASTARAFANSAINFANEAANCADCEAKDAKKELE
jgi:hypothetical protein